MKKNIIIAVLTTICATLAGLSLYVFKRMEEYQTLIVQSTIKLENCHEAFQHYTDKQLQDTLLKNIEHDLTSQPIISNWSFIQSSLAASTSDQTKNERIIGYLSGRILVLETPQDLNIIANPDTTSEDIKAIASQLAESGEQQLQSTAFKEGIHKGVNDALLELHNRLKIIQSHK